MSIRWNARCIATVSVAPQAVDDANDGARRDPMLCTPEPWPGLLPEDEGDFTSLLPAPPSGDPGCCNDHSDDSDDDDDDDVDDVDDDEYRGKHAG